jgi:hypothetical protein
MEKLRTGLNSNGITHAENLYSADDIAAFNAALDPHFAALASEHRSYAYARDLDRLGILERLVSDGLVSSFFEVMDQPLFYHLHAYEIAARHEHSHIAETYLSGWHRDVDSSYETAAPSHLSLFVYLTEVQPHDGPFEFLNDVPQGRFRNGAPASRMTGPRGAAFYWNRYFYHRAAPNRGSVRRRVLKYSIQSNRYPSRTMKAEHFAGVAAKMQMRDEARRLLFGAYAETPGAPLLRQPASQVRYTPVAPNVATDVDPVTMLKSQIRDIVRPLRRKAGPVLVPNYD